MRTRLALCLAAASIGAFAAQPLQEGLALHTRQHLDARVFEFGLDRDHSFQVRTIQHDAFLNEDDVRVDQHYKGVKVFGGEVIVHMMGGQARKHTDAMVRGLNLHTTPSIHASEALGIAHSALAPKGAYASEPTAELVIAPVGKGHVLAYHIHTELENGTEETAHTDFFVDAHTGAILKTWSTLHTGKPGSGGSTTGIAGTAAVGTGKTQFSGTVALNTTKTSAGTYALQDMTRGTGGTFGHNLVTNLNHATSGNGTIYQSDADNIWGDGTNYTGTTTSTTGATGQTAAADAAFGVQVTWDMYKNVFARNGIDALGKATYSRVHYSSSYDNAFWSDTCFCMTYGDGSSFKSLEATDVCGHELSHGVCANSAKLAYSGETGGLNEANSDIFGTLAEFYDLGGGAATGATTIPATGGNYTIGEQLETAKYTKPLRYMYKPSLDGTSPDSWSSTLGTLDVHYSSGVANHFFFLLAHGSQIDALSGNIQSPMVNGVASITGLGNQKAGQIWYRALTKYMTSSTNYAGARTATLSAVTDLYGATSAEYTAVNNAWLAVNVK